MAAKVTKSTSTWWTKYLRASETNLFKRSYDAIGFYASMESDGAPMFASLAQILEGGVISSGAAYKVALAAVPQPLLDNIGSMFFEDQSALDWHYRTTTGNPPPYNPGGLIPDAVDVSVGKGISVPLTVGPRSARLLRIHPTSDFVHIVASGHASSLDDAGTETHEISDNWLCTHEDPKDCQCPENTTGQAPDSVFASGDIRFAEAAGDDPETATVAGASIDDFCKDEDKYCADVKRLAGFETRDQAAIANGSVNPASPAFLQQAITDRVAVLHDMSADAPAEIAPHVKPYEAGYDKYAAVFAAAGYDVSKASRTDADAAINALAAVTRTDLPVIISDAKTRCDIVIPQASPR